MKFSIIIPTYNRGNSSLNIKPVILGDGEERFALTKLSKELNIEHTVILPGHRSNVLDYLSDFDIFVLPSISI